MTPGVDADHFKNYWSHIKVLLQLSFTKIFYCSLWCMQDIDATKINQKTLKNQFKT